MTAFLYYQDKQSRIHNVSGIVSFCQEESVSDDYLVNSVTLVTAVQLRFTTALCAVKMIRWIIFSKSGKGYARRLVGVAGSNPAWGAMIADEKAARQKKHKI